ncbi:4-alpha-glucanotransferase [Oxalicibacterium faecigallinarum]|uniref:4-alpha-glucanotransferase n=1 Tax=Oxalicibacterium faecigallinarum TaxID=573741 RepID=A0A8J3AVL4_9BURK|nr:4-alpha-glucanotransferase [Oxalicibacterium faecigallinarum]GGI20964.1 4-alpha-glucanotransferase [Oxalicibacterium faecigallinarum]
MNARLNEDHIDRDRNDALLKLAQAAGLSVEWTDAYGQPQQVSGQTLRTVLTALQFDCSSDAACAASILTLQEDEERLALPPLITAQQGHEIVFSPLARIHGKAYRLVLEDESEQSGHISGEHDAPARMPAVHAMGYHRLYIDGEHPLTLAVAPVRCFSVSDAAHDRTPHLWALAAQLYSLRRADKDAQTGDAGIGDFTALEQLAQSAARHGASGIAISPVHAMFSANPWHYSPYGPSSRLLFNVLHIDPASVSGEQALSEAIADLENGEERKHLQALEYVDWPTATKWRLTVLRYLFDHYDIHTDGWKAFERFRNESGTALEDHARFEALHADMRSKGIEGSWKDWPEDLRDPHSDAVARFAETHDNEITFHAFLQWQAALGLQRAQQRARDSGMAIGLITDLAVGAEGGGSQAWSRQSQMLNGLSVGAPPDLLGPQGQSWGLTAFSPRALREYGYQAYIEMLRAAFAYAGGVRIDHILGLARMWLVPQGQPGTEGVYLRYPFEELMRLIALESHRHRAIVIGEDLGTVPAGFDKALADAGLMGIRVLWFEQEHGMFRSPDHWSSQAIATTATHDLPTVAGWWQGRDIEWREQLSLLAPGVQGSDEHAARGYDRTRLCNALKYQYPERTFDCDSPHPPLNDLLEFVASTPAPLVIIPLEDVLGLLEQPNVPNTIDEHPNWRRRLPETTDHMLDRGDVAQRLSILEKARQAKGNH